MRILHTSDWHIGKHIGRYDRAAEFREALREVQRIAEAHAVDLVVVSGDLWDRATPPTDALGDGLEALIRLADGGRRPVVAIAGNHDSGDLFEVLAPLVQPMGVHLVGHIRRPGSGGEGGGLLILDTPGGRAALACVPFLREGRVVDFMLESGQWYGEYKDRLSGIFRAMGEALDREAAEAVTVLVAHATVNGAVVHGQQYGRGERELHMGETYTIDAAGLPPGPQYIAMGHIHAPQRVPGAPGPAEYAGSLLPLDFGEADEQKRVVLIEATPRVSATVRSIALDTPRRFPLVRAQGTWDELLARRDEFAGAYLDLVVTTTGPDPALAARATETFDRLVRVRAEYPRPTARAASRAGRTWDELYGEYHEREHGEPPSDAVRTAFTELHDEVVDATA
ncbi:MAG: exonuclease SbcCD subunit D [Dehalococcoidia bacterium]|nr:exonuclease SbcCD subunit D [Dehalococcoidia bacterium]